MENFDQRYLKVIFKVGTDVSWLKISAMVLLGSEQMASKGMEFQLVSKSSPK